MTAAVGAKRGTSVNTLNFGQLPPRQPIRHAMPPSPRQLTRQWPLWLRRSRTPSRRQMPSVR
jgi:hypothetical protein